MNDLICFATRPAPFSSVPLSGRYLAGKKRTKPATL